MDDTAGQQHPVAIYLKIWLALFVFSTFSYMVDWFGLQGFMRWTLILFFMFLKAGLIVAIFMHLSWERLALKSALLLPLLAIALLVAMMSIEGDHTYATRLLFFARQ